VEKEDEGRKGGRKGTLPRKYFLLPETIGAEAAGSISLTCIKMHFAGMQLTEEEKKRKMMMKKKKKKKRRKRKEMKENSNKRKEEI